MKGSDFMKGKGYDSSNLGRTVSNGQSGFNESLIQSRPPN
jgi:hypothetical protein